MKNLLIILTLLLSFTGFSQIDIEILTPEGEYKTATNDSAKVCLEVVDDSTLKLYSEGYEIIYEIAEITLTTIDTGNGFFTITELTIANDPRFAAITMWEGMNLVMFEYHTGKFVLNSGEGLEYH